MLSNNISKGWIQYEKKKNPPKKFYIPQFLKQRDINSYYRLEIHLLVVCIFDPACELLPPWTKELYLCTVAPLLYLLSDLLPPPPLPNVQYIQTVCDCGGRVGRCWNVLWTIFCRSFTLCFWPDSEPTKLLHDPKQKCKDDIKGLVSLKFLRPWI